MTTNRFFRKLLAKSDLGLAAIAVLLLAGCPKPEGSPNPPSSNTSASTSTSTWSVANSPTTIDLNSVVWNGNSFYAFGKLVVATSANGSSWSAQSTPYVVDSVIWANNRFVGSRRDWGFSKMLTSLDGLTWTETFDPGSSGSQIDSSFIHANNQFLVLGRDSTGASCSYTSPDGTNWTQHANISSDVIFTSVVWDGSRYVAVGNLYSSGAAVYATSADGIAWNSYTLPTNTSLMGIAYGGGRYVISAAAGSVNNAFDVYVSTNLITWNKNSIDTNNGWQNGGDAQWLGNKFLVVGNAWGIMSSTDGTNWTQEYSSGFNDYAGNYEKLYSVAYSGTRFVAVGGNILGNGNRIMYSN